MPAVVKQREYRVYVVGGGYDYIRFLFENGYKGAKGIGDADFVLFTGGEDVTPSFYGQEALKTTSYYTPRDDFEKKVYEECLAAGIPMIGICRGGQFLNVMNDGEMWQHVEDHCQNHNMTILDTKRTILVTSTHHQMMIPHPVKGLVLAASNICTLRMSPTTTIETPNPKAYDDVEVVWYADTNCICFQPHPEYNFAPKACQDYFLECVDDYILPYVKEEK